MNNFIQDIRVLDDEQLKIVNEYIDTLTFKANTIFDADGTKGKNSVVHTGSVMSDGDFVTQILHEGMILRC